MQDSTGSVTVDGEHPEEIPMDDMGMLLHQNLMIILLTLSKFSLFSNIFYGAYVRCVRK